MALAGCPLQPLRREGSSPIAQSRRVRAPFLDAQHASSDASYWNDHTKVRMRDCHWVEHIKTTIGYMA